MKKILISLLLISVLLIPALSFAAPGDVVPDHQAAIWRIASHSTNQLAGLLTAMNTLPEAYRANNSQSEWAVWLKIQIALDFSGKMYYGQVYTDVMDRIINYNYTGAEIAPEYAAPTCTVNGTNIECDEDPTGAARNIVIYRYISGEFIEQNLTGTLDTGTWTFGPIASGTTNITLAYADEFASFPCVFLAIP